jgi:hypothetical protein
VSEEGSRGPIDPGALTLAASVRAIASAYAQNGTSGLLPPE